MNFLRRVRDLSVGALFKVRRWVGIQIASDNLFADVVAWFVVAVLLAVAAFFVFLLAT